MGDVILDKEKRVWKENNSLGHVAFEMPVNDGRCPMKYFFNWLGTEQRKIRGVDTISMWVVAVCSA